MARAVLVLMLVGILLTGGCATTGQGPSPTTPPTVDLRKTLFPVALHAAVDVATKNLVAWHPDLVPYLLQWLQAACAFSPGSATTPAQLQDLLTGALSSIPDMPAWAHAVIADFIPVVVGLIPIALQAAGAAFPEVGAVLLVASEVCGYIEQAIPPKLLPGKSS